MLLFEMVASNLYYCCWHWIAIMEALIYIFLLIGTLGILLFAVFSREPPKIQKYGK